MTLQDAITDALTAIGEISRGQSPSIEDLQHGLDVANALLQTWSINRLMLPSVKKLDLQLVVGQQDYTIGPTGADFTNERPVLIQTATIIIPGL